MTDLATPDLDGDGIDDLVASRWSGHSHVFFGNGAGELADRHDLDTRNDTGIGVVEVADLDGDGKPDLIYGSQPCELGQTHCRPPRLLVMPNALNGRPDH